MTDALGMATTDPKATTAVPTNNKRTRSQTTLESFYSFNPAASPLKQARRNVAANERPPHPHKSDPPPPPTLSSPSPSPSPLPSGADDNAAHDAMHDQHLKRPPSPATDAALLRERDPKRPCHGIFPPPKPSSLPPEPSTSTALPARAKSVPPLSSNAIPLLDLNNVPPSPRRSPTKFRIASVPRELPPRSPSPTPAVVPDTHPSIVLPLPPKSPTFSFDQTTPTPHPLDDVMTPMSPLTPLPSTMDNTLHDLDTTFDADATPVPKPPQHFLFPPLPPPPPPALEPTPQTSVAPAVAQQPKPASRQSTSFIPRASGVKARMKPKGKPGASTSAAAAEPAPLSKKVKNPRERDRKNSLLGGLMASAKPTPAQAYKRARSQPPTPSYLLPTTSSVARTSPVKPPAVVSRPVPHSRSASKGPPAVPQHKSDRPPKTLEDISEGAAETLEVEKPSETLEGVREGPLETLESHPDGPLETSEVKSGREDIIGTQEEPSGSEPLTPLTDAPSEVDPDERLNKHVEDVVFSPPDVPSQQVENDGQRMEEPELDQAPNSEPPPPPATGPPPLTLNSSLSTLTEALERLNAPPPSRSQTSLGFHRAAPGTSDLDDSRAGDASTGADGLTGSGGRGGRGGRGRGRGRGGKTSTLERPRPGTSMSMSSLPTAASKGKAVAAPDSTPGQKKLKQTTLMLPPPVPGSTRTTRLRAAALAAANAASSSSPAVSRTPAKEGGVLRQGVLTLGKPRSTGPSNSTPVLVAGPSAAASSMTTSSKAPSTSTLTNVAPTSTFLKPGSTLAKPVFGLGGLGVASGSSTKTPVTTKVSRLTAMRGRFGGPRVTQRVSKASSLPVVVGSPVKGGKARSAMDVDLAEDDLGAGGDTMFVEEPDAEGDGEMSTKDKIGEWLKNASKDVLRDLGHLSDEDEDGDGPANGNTSLDHNGTALAGASGPGPSSNAVDADGEAEKAKAREREARRNASRRASMASHLLSQSLSALPSTLTPDKAKDVKGKGRAVSSTYPAAVATPTAKDKDEGADTDDSGKKPAVPPAPRAHATRLATGALSTPPNAYKETGHRSAASQEGSGKGKGKAGAEESPAKLAVLKDCRIFVDVRTDEGDDAGGLFVEMLEGLGAKMANRVGSRCTHVVFKNGLMSTLSRYKLLSDPKPHVVGIAWVVECAEQCKKVDESPFRVNLDLVNVAGVNKRRKSYLPKHVSPVKMATATSPTSSDSARAGVGTMLSMGIGLGGPPPRSFPGGSDFVVAPAMAVGDDGDSSMPGGAGAAGEDGLEHLPPLERARRRKSMLPGK